MAGEAFKRSNYIPTLDGWRAVSIALVILHHSRVQWAVPVLGPLLRGIADAGEVGVEVFFAISGLLICSRLLDEESRVGQINIGNFYLRRFFRILPAAFLYLATIAVLGIFHLIPVQPFDWFAALLFFRNYSMLLDYLRHSPLALHWFTGHFWSLSMEEHFYFLLPAVLVFFRKTRRWILGGLAALVALWRFILAHVLHRDYQFSFRTDTHLDALLIPALVALMLFPVMRNGEAKRFLPAWSFLLLLGIEIVFLTRTVPFMFTLQAVVLPLMVLSTVLHPRAVPGRVLTSFPLRWIGWISYSLYLWQQLFFGVNLVGSPHAVAWLRAAPANFIGLFGCAAFSYYLIEKPFVRLGHRVLQAQAERNAERAKAFEVTPPSTLIETAS